jgi:hypothetical protein
MAQAVQGKTRRCARRLKKWTAKNPKDRLKWAEYEPWCTLIEHHMRDIAEEDYRNLFGGKELNSGLASGFFTVTMPMSMMH